jgi:hypothetical protein
MIIVIIKRLRNENVFRKVDVFHTRSPILTPYDVAKNYFEAISNFSIYYGQLPHNFTSVISTFVFWCCNILLYSGSSGICCQTIVKHKDINLK